LKQGGCLVVFPAGKVSHYQWGKNRVADDDWNAHAAALAQKTKAKVVPVFFEGRNSASFQLAGMVHPRLRTALLPREMVKREGETLRLSVGKAIGPEMARKFSSPEAFNHYLRLSTYALKGAGERQPHSSSVISGQEELAAPVPTQVLVDSIAELPPDAELLQKGEFSVYCQEGRDLPEPLMREIGRLREGTFREIGEGTGKALDLDKHDPHYHQLFLWNHQAAQLVGAYRLCLMDRVIEEFGQDGLYSAKLFDLHPSFLGKLGKTVELGRSFIRPEYQRKHSSLSLVWQGIGKFLQRHPGYGNLFGCVSLTSDYAPVSRDLMVEFLKRECSDNGLSHLAVGRSQPELSPLAKSLLPHLEDSGCTVEGVSAVVSSIEEDGKGIPVLLRHYLKLNGSLINFHVDKDFNNTTVGLILVRTKDIDPSFRKKFFGH
jgi:putative hemolysin